MLPASVSPKLLHSGRSSLDPKRAYLSLAHLSNPKEMTDQQESKSQSKADYGLYSLPSFFLKIFMKRQEEHLNTPCSQKVEIACIYLPFLHFLLVHYFHFSA